MRPVQIWFCDCGLLYMYDNDDVNDIHNEVRDCYFIFIFFKKPMKAI